MNNYITLNNGVKMPQLGLGVWQAKNGSQVEAAVTTAIDSGYRLIDTAAVYGNEQGVGTAIAHSGTPREELFITTKVWNADQGYERTLNAFDKSLARLQLDYIDLYLIHWPAPATDKYVETWKAMEKLYASGVIRAIGVSNFTTTHLERLLNESTVVPAVNQIEIHPRFTQTQLREYCRAQHIAVEAYSPLGGGGGDLLSDPVIAGIARRHGKSAAQVVIRWHIQNQHIVIPKSIHEHRIIENAEVFDFQLDADDMALLNSLDSDKRVGADPDTANFMLQTGIVQLAHKFGLVHW